MNPAVADMLARYELDKSGNCENALREIFQEIALLGLWRSNFFEHAAFYGGTALRVLHGLQRFSEDLDFSLLSKAEEFDFDHHCRFIARELDAWGFPVRMEKKHKTGKSAVESAFLKADTHELLLRIDAPADLRRTVHRNRVLRIKVEVDTDPPPASDTETRYLLHPIPFAVRAYTLPCLFAGKMHALLFRTWKNRVKGRDWYDFVWFAARDIPLDLVHLTARMKQTGHWSAEKPISRRALIELLKERIAVLNVDAARADISPFIPEPAQVDIWSADFFAQVAGTIRVSDIPAGSGN